MQSSQENREIESKQPQKLVDLLQTPSQNEDPN